MMAHRKRYLIAYLNAFGEDDGSWLKVQIKEKKELIYWILREEDGKDEEERKRNAFAVKTWRNTFPVHLFILLQA